MREMTADDDHPPSPIQSIRRWIASWFSDPDSEKPQNRDDLVKIVGNARDRNVVDSETFDTVQRVLQVAELRVRDVMVPRSQMIILDRDNAFEQYVEEAVKARHSRYPVIDGDRDRVVGILLAKDLLRYTETDERDDFDLRDILRPAVFIPESKRLNVLLNEFRASRNHMAIVVDEYGGTAGLVTIEDVLEQIVGNIEDEHDMDDDAVMIADQADGYFIVKALCPLDEFNEYFSCQFDEDEYDTVAGLVIAEIGHVPNREETVEIGDFNFEVVHADSRRLHLLRVQRQTDHAA